MVNKTISNTHGLLAWWPSFGPSLKEWLLLAFGTSWPWFQFYFLQELRCYAIDLKLSNGRIRSLWQNRKIDEWSCRLVERGDLFSSLHSSSYFFQIVLCITSSSFLDPIVFFFENLVNLSQGSRLVLLVCTCTAFYRRCQAKRQELPKNWIEDTTPDTQWGCGHCN